MASNVNSKLILKGFLNSFALIVDVKQFDNMIKTKSAMTLKEPTTRMSAQKCQIKNILIS